MLPAPSRALRLKVWVPCVRPVNAFEPLVPLGGQEAKATLSMRQENVAVSFVVHLKVAVVELSTAGGVPVRVMAGATVSVVQVKLAGLRSRLPAPSIPRARKLWEPSCRLESGIENGEVQPVNAALSRLHCSVASASVVIVNDAAPLFGSGGVAVNAVSGAALSIVQLKLAGVGSLSPEPSVAATLKMC